MPSNLSVHFGLNEIGLLTTYARDVARLREWERPLWSGFNVTPDGKVSSELLMAQVEAKAASSKAPEAYLSIVLQQLNSAWETRFGTTILREHKDFDKIISRIHRFRSIDQHGLLALAKDLARLTADLIIAKAAQVIIAPPKGENWGSLKSLEKALGTIAPPELAYKIIGPLFATYESRLSDAHIPKKSLLEACELLKIGKNRPVGDRRFQDARNGCLLSRRLPPYRRR